MISWRKSFACAALIALAAGLYVCDAGALRRTSSGETPAARAVTIDNFSFAPATTTVPAGSTVIWINRDDIPHTVVSEDKSTFKSKPLDTDDKFSYQFTKPGTYTYFCSIHPKMTAKVVVQ
ncbi:MAG TPA: cupredoxin family copper-binding protein [Candidatus Acidoferrum sp.]